LLECDNVVRTIIYGEDWLWRKWRFLAEMVFGGNVGCYAIGCASVAVGYVQTGRYLRALQKKISDFLLLKFWVRDLKDQKTADLNDHDFRLF
jgi:hypothetical protein